MMVFDLVSLMEMSLGFHLGSLKASWRASLMEVCLESKLEMYLEELRVPS